MIKEQDILTIQVNTRKGVIVFYIEPNSEKDKLYVEDAVWPGETPYHLMEGCSYRYEIAGGQDKHEYQLESRPEIVFWRQKQRHHSEGILKTGIYVGTLNLGIMDYVTHEHVCNIELEIRSVKTDYQSDYRTMLSEIAEYYTDLVLQQGSPVSQKLEIDDTADYKTLYQKFSFMRFIAESEAFAEAIHKVISNPVRKWTETTEQRSIVGVKRLSRQNLRQLAASNDRMPLPASWQQQMPAGLTSVPRYLTQTSKRDTVDNQENQFIKFVLRTFIMFCSELRQKRNCTNPLKAEIDRTCDVINLYLDNQFFRQVSMPTHMNMNSPVLQRKEGYREVLQAWLLFDLSAKLAWRGGDDIYDAGKKNVATLYEYWLFFKLLELISEFFHLDKGDKEKLVRTDEDGINLDLCQGRMKMIGGKHQTNFRLLNVAFYYNRTFSKVADKDDPIHKAGSWTMSMRPDYTLSLWPGTISEAEAESQELITHIHFDAKYRLNKVLLDDEGKTQSDNAGDDYLQEEKRQQEMGVYKRADLLKMHAYKDAIRRTSGAYVLYPGDTTKKIRGFHEIVPGLGAFSVRPGHWKEDSLYLKLFLAEVKKHLLDRTSEREKLSYFQYDIYKEENPTMMMDNLPEPEGENRDFLPDETYVLVGYCATYNQDFVLDNYMYNVRTGDRKGALDLAELLKVKYALIWNESGWQTFQKVNKRGTRIFADKALVAKGYTTSQMYKHMERGESREEAIEAIETDDFYAVVSFNKNGVEKEFRNSKWNTTPFARNHAPQVMSLPQLLKYKK